MHFEHIFRSLAENTNDVIMVLDNTPLEESGPFIVYVNPAFERLMGYAAKEVVGQNPKILQGPETDDKARYKLRQAMRTSKAIRTQILNYDKFGHKLWLDINMVPLFDEDGELAYYAAIERDLTEYKRLQSQLENLANTDSLTGLSNRQSFMHRAEKEFSRARRYSRPLSAIMIDVDRFKTINDHYGHAVGDIVLRHVGAICQQGLRNSDLLGRIGGEEFVVLLPDTPLGNAIYVAERMREQLERTPIETDKLLINMTASFGVASLTDPDHNFNSILDRADVAMYHAKHNGRNRVKSAA